MLKIVKHAATDISTLQLPSNRREAFADVVKQRWLLLLRLGLIFCGFCLPLIILTFTNATGTQTIYLQIASGTLAECDGLAQIAAFQVSSALMQIPCFALLAAGLSPVSLIVIKLSWQQGILFGADFRKSLKQDSLGAGLIGLLVGLFNFLSIYLKSLFAANAQDFLSFAGFVSQFLFYIAVLPVFSLFVPLHSIYSDPIAKKVKHAFWLYIHSLPQILIFCLIAYGLLSPALIGNPLANTAILLIYCCLVFPFLHLAWILYCNKLFDLYINRHYFPELVNRGLWYAD